MAWTTTDGTASAKIEGQRQHHGGFSWHRIRYPYMQVEMGVTEFELAAEAKLAYSRGFCPCQLTVGLCSLIIRESRI